LAKQPLQPTAAAMLFSENSRSLRTAAAAERGRSAAQEGHMAGKLIVQTERLCLREFDEDDAAPFYLLGSDPAVLRYTGDPGGGLRSVEHALDVLRSRPMADYRTYGYGRWACVLKANGEVIGFAGLKYLADVQEVDIGYRLLPAYWGQGLATEACRAVLNYGRTRLGLERIIGLVDPKNVASVRVLKKLGLMSAGQIEYQGKWVAKYVMPARATT
jgi:RimJ/RimL family protein N-acetyltransferase